MTSLVRREVGLLPLRLLNPLDPLHELDLGIRQAVVAVGPHVWAVKGVVVRASHGISGFKER